MATCVAMIAGVDENECYAEWHGKFQRGHAWLDTALQAYGVPYFYGTPRSGKLLGGFAYLLTVPSLNIRGGLHQVVAIYTKAGDIKILDPVKGRDGFHYVYDNPSEDSKEFEITSWTIDLIIPLEDL